jgi:hypothetical protein
MEEHDPEDPNVWWVFVSRAIQGFADLGIAGNDEFWPQRSSNPESV